MVRIFHLRGCVNYGFYTLYSMCESLSDDLKDQIILLIWNKYGSSVVILELDLVICNTSYETYSYFRCKQNTAILLINDVWVIFLWLCGVLEWGVIRGVISLQKVISISSIFI